MTKLFIVEGPDVGLSFEIGEGTTFVGRTPENEVHIDDQSVSRKHSKITRKGDKFYIEDLSRTNTSLTQEIAIRQQAEENLKAMHQQLKEANRNLELAYAQMRDAKDHLGTQLYGEEIAFLLDDKGQILGFNEKALEITGQSRFKLLGRNIGDLLEQDFRDKVLRDIRDAWKGVFHQTSLGFKGGKAPKAKFQAKLIPVDLEREKRLLLLVRRLDRKG